LITELYEIQKKTWPSEGQHILAQYDEDSVVVYQAFNEKIANFAVENQFFGGDDYSTTRMTWIKTNFLWMQYRSNWSSKSNQTNTLAIWVKRSFFDKVLGMSLEKKKDDEIEKKRGSSVRLQWDPDHLPNGENCIGRKALQIGVKGDILNGFLMANGDILHIEDISEFIHQQYNFVKGKQYPFKDLMMPFEREYVIKDEKLWKHLMELDPNEKKNKQKKKNNFATTIFWFGISVEKQETIFEILRKEDEDDDKLTL